MAKRELEYKPLLYTTTVRNPERMKALLFILEKFNSRKLNDRTATEVVAETIRYGLYRPMNKTERIKNKWKSTPLGTFAEEILTDAEVDFMLRNNPQNHKEAGFAKGFPSRFATIFDFAKELGFVYFSNGEEILFSESGHKLANIYNVSVTDGIITVSTVHPEYEQQVFLQAMVKSQRKNPFVRVLNDNVPLILLLQTIKKLNNNPEYRTQEGETKGISRKELPLLIFWKDNNAENLYQRIVKLRKEYGYAPSDEVIGEICTEEISNGFKEFKLASIINEYPDEFIRKMRITGLISVRGAGRFIDINHNEDKRIEYILSHYSTYKTFTDERAYFNYMAETDGNLLSLQQKETTSVQNEKLLAKWLNVYTWDSIKKEMGLLSRRSKSGDSVLKLLPAPVRLEFLVALSIKSRLPNVRVYPQYSCDDTGLPTSTAGGGVSDIECFEGNFGITVEVTMAEGRTQTTMEVWPIERHLKEFIDKTGLLAQTVFVAPSIFNDSKRQIEFVLATSKLQIRPYRISDFIDYLENSQTLYR